MERNDIDDEKMEELFRTMPDIKDKRSKEDILMKLKQDSRLTESKKRIERKKRPPKWLPALIAISAILLIGLLLPSMIKDGNRNESADSSLMKNSMEENGGDMQAEFESTSQEDRADSAVTEADDSHSAVFNKQFDGYFRAVYPSDIEDGTVFHMGLAGEAAASVPVTFVISKAEIDQEFDEGKLSSLDLYNQFASRIDEEALGFTSYHPYKAQLRAEEDVVILRLPDNHGYDIASATLESFFGTIHDTFYGLKEVKFENEDGSPVEFDQIGQLNEPLPLMGGENQVNYYLFKQETGEEFLSSNVSKSYNSLEHALNDMKTDPNDIYASVIPETIDFELDKEKDYTVISFNKPLDLEAMPEKNAQQFIDAILLTAASFGEQIQFENTVQNDWHGLNLNEPLPVPIGANFLPFLLKD